MQKVLGIVSLALVVVITSPYWLRILNRWTFRSKNRHFLRLLRFLRKLHKGLGVVLALVAIAHGWLELSGRISLHTGLLTYLSFFVAAGLGAMYARLKSKPLLRFHRFFAMLGFLLMLLHLVEPWALGKWFNLW